MVSKSERHVNCFVLVFISMVVLAIVAITLILSNPDYKDCNYLGTIVDFDAGSGILTLDDGQKVSWLSSGYAENRIRFGQEVCMGHTLTWVKIDGYYY